VKKSHIPTFAPSLPPANKRQIEPFSSSPFPPQPTTTPHAYVSTIGISTSNQIFVTSATSSGAYVMTASTCTPSAPPSVTSVAAYVKMPWITSTLVEDSTSSSTCSNSGDTVILSWPLWKVFVGGYLPVFLAILFKVFWTSIYANVKLIEPFIQLSRPGGASAKDAFSTCYLSNNLTPVPVIALFNGRWLMFWTSIVYLIVGFLPPLASESLFRDTNYNCSNPNPAQSQNPCWPRLSMDPTIIRLLQGLLSFVAIITLTIMYMVFRSSTGITSDPSSIAFVACLIHHPDVLANFRRITDQESDEDIKSLFAKKFYQLRTYLGSDGVERYGIVPCSPAHLLEDSIGTTHAPEENKARKTKTSKNFLDISFVIFILGILGVIISYFKDGANDSFNRFFNSNSFGPRFFMVSRSCPTRDIILTHSNSQQWEVLYL
jgi:hypothetical protein